jgi:hypothetical protein
MWGQEGRRKKLSLLLHLDRRTDRGARFQIIVAGEMDLFRDVRSRRKSGMCCLGGPLPGRAGAGEAERDARDDQSRCDALYITRFRKHG